jgi:orotate phosphoribosyltransferase-like protein
MALKSDRFELQTDISVFYNAGTATRGCVVVHDTAGSGAAMDQGVNLVKKHTAGVPVGVLLNDVVNKDLTRTHLNQHKDEVQKGGKVTVLRKGYVVTDAIDTAQDPVAGSGAYASTGTAGNVGMVGTYQVGRFLSTKDEDGYAKVEVNLP